METLNPHHYWTRLQKTYYLIQIKKLILEIGDRGERSKSFNKLLADFEISLDEVETVLLSDPTPNKTAKRLFEDSNNSDKAFILASYLLITIAEDSFDVEEHVKGMALFTNIFGLSIPNTLRDLELIFEDNPLLAFEFRAKKI